MITDILMMQFAAGINNSDRVPFYHVSGILGFVIIKHSRDQRYIITKIELVFSKS